nr:MAG TPA: hypothetical protein [Caudoviricetes sp.]
MTRNKKNGKNNDSDYRENLFHKATTQSIIDSLKKEHERGRNSPLFLLPFVAKNLSIAIDFLPRE